MRIDPPTPQFSFVPTTAYEYNWVRSYGQAFCLDNGIPQVEFTYTFAHQWDMEVTVTAEGFMRVEGDINLSPEQERVEVKRIHGVQ